MVIVNLSEIYELYVIDGFVFCDYIKYSKENIDDLFNRFRYYGDNGKNELLYAINKTTNTKINDTQLLNLLQTKNIFKDKVAMFDYLFKNYINNSLEISLAFASINTVSCVRTLTYELKKDNLKYREEIIEHVLHSKDLYKVEPMLLTEIVRIGDKKHINFIFNWIYNHDSKYDHEYLNLNIELSGYYAKSNNLIYLQYFLKIDDVRIHDNLLKSKNDTIIDLLIDYGSTYTLKRLAEIDNLNRLRTLVKHESKEVRGIVTRHNHEELLDILVKDSDSHVRYCLASNQYKNKKYLKKLIKDPNRRVREYSISLYEDLELTWFERFRLSILKFNNVMHM